VFLSGIRRLPPALEDTELQVPPPEFPCHERVWFKDRGRFKQLRDGDDQCPSPGTDVEETPPAWKPGNQFAEDDKLDSFLGRTGSKKVELVLKDRILVTWILH